MFAATLTLTIGGTAYVLNRLNQDDFGSEYGYSGADRSISMKIRHSLDSRDSDGIQSKRHNVFVEHIIFPTPASDIQKFTSTVTLRHGQFNAPSGAADLTKALHVLLAASSSQMITDLSVGVN